MIVLTGYLALMMGIAHILVMHSVTAHWTIILTLIGCVIFLKGLICLAAPRFTQKLIKSYSSSMITIPLILMVLVGLYLAKKGF